MPDHKSFSYTFDNYAAIMDQLLDELGVSKYAIYVFDYGALLLVTGWLCHIRNELQDSSCRTEMPMRKGCSNSGIRSRNIGRPRKPPADLLHGDFREDALAVRERCQDKTLLDPATWTLDQMGLDRPGNGEIPADQPPTLIVWGKNDFVFPPEGATPYSRDLKNIETHSWIPDISRLKRTEKKLRAVSSFSF
jgi:pimeloyl-ACP methyl ester carboxylesterase